MAGNKEKSSHKNKRSLRKRILFYATGLVLVSVIGFATVSFIRLNVLSGEVETQSKEHSKNIEDYSKSFLFLNELGERNILIDHTADILGYMFEQYGSFLSILKENILMITMFPQIYHESYIPNPIEKMDGRLCAQIMWPDKDKHKQDENAFYTRLMDQIPTMYHVINENSCFGLSFAMPDGCTVFYDKYAANKLDENGRAVAYDPRKETWYRDAIKGKDIVYHCEKNPPFYDTPEIVTSLPVYTNKELLCVLSLHVSVDKIGMNLLNEVIGEDEYVLLFDQNGLLAATTKSSGDFSPKDIMNPDAGKTSGEQDPKRDIHRILNSEHDIDCIVIDDDSYYTFTDSIHPSEWSEVIISKEKKLYQAMNTVQDLFHEAYSEMDTKMKSYFRATATYMVLFIIILLIITIILSIRISGRITRPINLMTKKVLEMTGDNIVFEMLPEYDTRDEIGILAGTFSEMSETLQQQVKEIMDISAENERMETELRVATKIQAGLLPKSFPLFADRDEFDLFASMDPAREVGGDLYDAFLIDDDHLAMVVADVSDKGVPSALFMVVSKTLIKTRALQGGGPAEILTDVNNMLCDENAENLFVTAWLGILTISTGEVVEANAGHDKPILKGEGGEFDMLRAKHGLVLGYTKGLKYREDSFIMNPGDTLFVYTDGAMEAMKADEEKFGKDRLLQVLNENKELPPDELLPIVKQRIKEFMAGEAQFDDITMLAMKINRKSERTNP